MKMLICDRRYDLNIMLEAERLLLNKVGWKVNIHTAFDLIEVLLESFVDASEIKNSFNSIKEVALNWVAFSFDEYQLYLKYDQATLAFASVLNAFADEGMIKSLQKLKEFMIAINVDKSLVLACMNDMMLEVTKLDRESVEDVSTSGSDVRTTVSVVKGPCKELLSKKRKRVVIKAMPKQTQIPQYIKFNKVKYCGKKKN
jgi:hypothetical protein